MGEKKKGTTIGKEEAIRGEVVVQKKKFIMVGGEEVAIGYQRLLYCCKKMEIHLVYINKRNRWWYGFVGYECWVMIVVYAYHVCLFANCGYLELVLVVL